MKKNNPQLNPNVQPLYDELSVKFIASTGKFESENGQSFDNAKDAFDLVVSKDKPFTGIALKYDINKKPNKSKILTCKLTSSVK